MKKNKNILDVHDPQLKTRNSLNTQNFGKPASKKKITIKFIFILLAAAICSALVYHLSYDYASRKMQNNWGFIKR